MTKKSSAKKRRQREKKKKSSDKKGKVVVYKEKPVVQFATIAKSPMQPSKAVARPNHTFHAIKHPGVRSHLLSSGKSNRVAAMLHQLAEPTTCLLIRTKDPSSITPEGTALAKLTSTFDVEWGPRVTTQLYPEVNTNPYTTSSTVLAPMFGDSTHFGAILTRNPIVPLITRTENKMFPVFPLTKSRPCLGLKTTLSLSWSQ